MVFHVNIHYEGGWGFDIEAPTEEEARQIAQQKFESLSPETLVLNFADVFIDDCFVTSKACGKFLKYRLSNLKKALKAFEENGKYAKCGDWSVAAGGYDLQFIVYYQENEVLRCIGNELESVPYSAFSDEFRRYIKKYVRKIYPDITA